MTLEFDTAVKTTRHLVLVCIMGAFSAIYGAQLGGIGSVLLNLFAGAAISSAAASWRSALNERARAIERKMATFWEPFVENGAIIVSSLDPRSPQAIEQGETSIFTPFYDAVSAYTVQEFLRKHYAVTIPILEARVARHHLNANANVILIGGPNFNPYTADILKGLTHSGKSPFYNWSSSFLDDDKMGRLITSSVDHFVLIQGIDGAHYKLGEYLDAPFGGENCVSLYGMVLRLLPARPRNAVLVLAGADNALGTLAATTVATNPGTYDREAYERFFQSIVMGRVVDGSLDRAAIVAVQSISRATLDGYE